MNSTFWRDGSRILDTLTCKVICAVVAFGILGAGIIGCGGSGSGSSLSSTTAHAKSKAIIAITWPARTAKDAKLIPEASNSIVITFFQGATVVSTQTIVRPTTSLTTSTTFTNLPVGQLTVEADAKPDADGTGTTQATASTTTTIVAGQTTSVSIDMASTISTLAITDADTSVAVGSTTNLALAAYDSSDNVVLLSSSTITWTSATTSVATVSSTGVVTGVAAGTSVITATDSESGKSATFTVTVTAAVSTNCASDSGVTATVCYADAWLATLTTTEQATADISFTETAAENWNNLPINPSQRNGIDFADMTTAQQTAGLAFVHSALSTEGQTTFDDIRLADDVLEATAQNGAYGSDLYHIAILGTPSTTGTWEMQVTGHHYANNTVFNNGTATMTPNFDGVEPQSFTENGTTYQVMLSRETAMYAMINSLTTSELASAELSTRFSDVLLGPTEDDTFPTQQGVLVSTLDSSQQALVETAMQQWVDALPTAQAATVMDDYTSSTALADTYIAWSGSTTPDVQGSYVRIDGPRCWMEFVCQNGVVFPSQIHFHSVWRDKAKDYGGLFFTYDQ